MKKILLLAAVFATGMTTMAQQKADEVMKVNTEKYDFGKIKQGVPVTTFFIVTNTSDKPIFIESATAGCGCTTPEFSKEPIAPNGTTQLKVGYNAATMGHFDKTVSIKVAGFQDPKIINITGVVIDGNGVDALAANQVKKVEKATEKKAATQAKVVKKAKKVKTDSKK